MTQASQSRTPSRRPPASRLRHAVPATALCWSAVLGWSGRPARADGKVDRVTVDWATYNPLSVLIRREGLLEKELAGDGIAVRGVQSAGSNKALEDLGPSPRIGMVFQEPRLMPWLRVAGNVGFGLAHLPAPDRRRRVGEALAGIGWPAPW